MSKLDNPMHMQTKSRTSIMPAREIEKRLFCVTHPERGNEFVDWTLPIGEVTRLKETYTPNSDGNKNQWKSFQHHKVESGDPLAGSQGITIRQLPWEDPHIAEAVVIDPYFGYYQYWQNHEYAPYGDPGNPIAGLPEFLVTPDQWGNFILPPDDIGGLVQRALRSMLPNIKSDLSILNSLYELKDFKRPVSQLCALLGPTRNKRYGLVQKLQKKLGKLFERGVSVERVIQMAAGNFLEAEFNILPLLSDIRGVYTALSRAERRINDLITRSGRRENKHWMFTFSEFEDVHDTSATGFWAESAWNQTIGAERFVTYQPSVFHAQIQYNYNYTDYQVAHAQLLAVLDGFGVNLNPAIIWNALPWSFVVDWVFGVSRFLNDFKVENMKPKINICRFCWSIKRERSITVMKGIVTDDTGRWKDRNMLPRVRETAYRRHVGFPDASLIESSGLTPMEFSLGAALVLSRRRKPRQHRH